MMRFSLNSIFSKNTKPVYQHQSKQNSDNQDEYHFSVSEIKPQRIDYEVTEISFEEFTNPVFVERRKHPRKAGETRKAYSTH